MLSPLSIASDASSNQVVYEPMGVLLAIMPWNFPFWQLFRVLAPNLMAGNVVLLKHASNVQGCANEIVNQVNPDGELRVIENLAIPGNQTPRWIGHPSISAVTLTGSETAGAAAASEAGKFIKPSVLELGGSDPYIVWADAVLEAALDQAVVARFQNNGQSCIAAKRFIIHERVYQTFRDGFVERVQQLSVGDPMDPETQIGPVAKPEFAQELKMQIDHAVNQGASILTGGRVDGCLVEPTVLESVPETARIYREEVFGPVAALYCVDSEDAAIDLANRTEFGLCASIWSKSDETAQRIAARLNCGAVYINQFSKSDPRLPFGGTKRSGYGRELGEWGIRAFTNPKLISIA